MSKVMSIKTIHHLQVCQYETENFNRRLNICAKGGHLSDIIYQLKIFIKRAMKRPLIYMRQMIKQELTKAIDVELQTTQNAV